MYLETRKKVSCGPCSRSTTVIWDRGRVLWSSESTGTTSHLMFSLLGKTMYSKNVFCGLCSYSTTAHGPHLRFWRELIRFLNSTTKSQKITAINATRSNFSSLFLTTKILIFNRTLSRISFPLVRATQQNFLGVSFVQMNFRFSYQFCASLTCFAFFRSE